MGESGKYLLKDIKLIAKTAPEGEQSKDPEK